MASSRHLDGPASGSSTPASKRLRRARMASGVAENGDAALIEVRGTGELRHLVMIAEDGVKRPTFESVRIRALAGGCAVK